MPPPPRAPSRDPLRYGQRALDEMARAQASVAVPARVDDGFFAPSATLRPPAVDGAALSLRLFADAEDATAFVLRDATSVAFAPVPARAAALFDAHAAALAYDGESELVVGLPLASFTHQGQRRVAPLVSWSGARARWSAGDAPWRLPPDARVGAALAPPTALALEAPRPDGDAPFTLHAGVWYQLFGLDGAALSALALAGRGGVAALVRAAARVLAAGTEDALDDGDLPDGPLTRDDLRALCDAAAARAQPRHDVRCHPHAVAMLLPRGDPTSGLRAELDALLAAPAPASGPLAVFLGAAAAPPARAPLWSCGPTPPTPSQTAAATALEGSRDLVAVCGPPGCGKTALLHHLAAHAVVDRALDDTWARKPALDTPWALVVTSTNNAAVDHALAPFVRSRALPVGLRLGNRRTLAEATADALAAAVDALDAPDGPSLAGARAAFDALAAPARAAKRALADAARARDERAPQVARWSARAAELRSLLAQPGAGDAPGAVPLAAIEQCRAALDEHRDAAARVAPLHLDGPDASVERARERWARANERRGAVIAPVLAKLALPVPYGDLDPGDPRADLERQREAMAAVRFALERLAHAHRAPGWRRELDAMTAALAAAAPDAAADAPPPDPALVDAALAVRDAWARAHRAWFVPRLREAVALLRDERRPERGRPPPVALRALAPLFPLAGCTLLSMRASFPLEDDVIDRLVIDEAGQCAPVYAVPALARARRALVAGDTAQLPPVYTVDDRADARLARGLDAAAIEPFRMGTSATTSAQAVGEARAAARLALVEHFRSQPAIVALASAWSGYALDVRTPPRSLAGVSPWLDAPVRVMAVRGVGERAREGVVNEAEARAAVALVEALAKDGVALGDVAVLTPFVGQSARIERALAGAGLTGEGGVLVRTVHRLQGGERRVVVLSIVATERKHLRWLAERPHLLHVATSRAQDHLVVLVHPDRVASEPVLAPLALARGAARG